MKKFIPLVLCLTVLAAAAWAQSAGVSGTYYGKARGLGGDVTVTITLQNSKIVNVVAEGPNETPGIGSRAIEQMPPKMVAGNTITVDGVSGATVTSNAILNAAKSAMASAGL